MLDTQTLTPAARFTDVHLRLTEALDRINAGGVLGEAELRELHALTGEALALDGRREDCPHGLSNPAWCDVCRQMGGAL
jgi:hypothetical protein